jgi:hypothetical protein
MKNDFVHRIPRVRPTIYRLAYVVVGPTVLDDDTKGHYLSSTQILIIAVFDYHAPSATNGLK